MLKKEKLLKIKELKAEYAELDMKQNSKKLTLNSTYGLLANKYNFMYCPEQQINVCLTGQLFLLMCGEIIARNGGTSTSYNTDGLNFYCDKSDYDNIEVALFDLELDSGQVIEYTPYLSTFHESVNSYVAIKPDGVKGKGTFANESLMKSPNRQVCPDAIKAFFADGSDIDSYIRAETNPHKFCTVKRVTGGAMFEDEEVGKMVRFYHSTDGGVLTYKKNGNKVPTSDGCRPMMNLPDTLPDDIDYDWYINEANKLLKATGYIK